MQLLSQKILLSLTLHLLARKGLYSLFGITLCSLLSKEILLIILYRIGSFLLIAKSIFLHLIKTHSLFYQLLLIRKQIMVFFVHMIAIIISFEFAIIPAVILLIMLDSTLCWVLCFHFKFVFI